MKRAMLILSLTLTLSPVMGFAQEIYRWVDEKGTIHFVDDFTLVPEKHRDQIEKKTLSEKPSPALITPPRQPEPAESFSGQKDMLGRGEEWWRAKMKEWNDKLQEAQRHYDLIYSNLKQKEKELTDALFKPDSLKRKLRSELKGLEEKLKAWETERNEARRMLEQVLPKEAEDYRADPAWLKPKE